MLLKILGLLALDLCCSRLPAQTSDGYFDSKGTRIHYATAGQGEAIVLVHGWLSDATMWGNDGKGNAKLSPLPGFQVIAIDCRGHGKSDKPHNPLKYGAEMAEDVVRLLDHLRIKRAHLVGYSMGTFIVAKVAARHPDRVISLVYGGQAPLIPRLHPAGSPEIDDFAAAVEKGQSLGTYIAKYMPTDGKKLTPEQANNLAKYAYAGKDVRAWALAGKSFANLQVRLADLKKCPAPTLFICGENDPSKPSVIEVQKALGKGEVVIIKGSNHMTTLINPAFGSALVSFLLAHK